MTIKNKRRPIKYRLWKIELDSNIFLRSYFLTNFRHPVEAGRPVLVRRSTSESKQAAKYLLIDTRRKRSVVTELFSFGTESAGILTVMEKQV